MRIVGNQIRSELEPDPVRAVQRALTWRPADNVGSLPHAGGVFRGTQAFFNKMDSQRALAQARLLNTHATAVKTA